jgi:hypothetical protein
MNTCDALDPITLDETALEWARSRAKDALDRMSEAIESGNRWIARCEAASTSDERAKCLRQFRQSLDKWQAFRAELSIANSAIHAIQLRQLERLA